EYADHRGHPRELILRQRLLPSSRRHPVPGARRNPQQRRDFVPAQMPVCRDPLYRPDGDGTQPSAIGLVAKSIGETGAWSFLEAEAGFWRVYHLNIYIAPIDAMTRAHPPVLGASRSPHGAERNAGKETPDFASRHSGYKAAILRDAGLWPAPQDDVEF